MCVSHVVSMTLLIMVDMHITQMQFIIITQKFIGSIKVKAIDFYLSISFTRLICTFARFFSFNFHQFKVSFSFALPVCITHFFFHSLIETNYNRFINCPDRDPKKKQIVVWISKPSTLFHQNDLDWCSRELKCKMLITFR